MPKAKAKKISHFEVGIGNDKGSNSACKGSRNASKTSSYVKTASKKKTRSYAYRNQNLEILPGKVTLDIPIKTVSEANCFEPWQKKYARHKEQKNLVSLALSPLRGKISLPCRIFLTRFAPDELDTFDNLPMSFKYIVDSVCAIITGEYRAGKADSDKRISIACGQVESKAYGIRIEISF